MADKVRTIRLHNAKEEKDNYPTVYVTLVMAGRVSTDRMNRLTNV